MTGGGTLRTGKSSNDTGMSGTGGTSSMGKASAANSASDGELSIYLSKTQDSSKMMWTVRTIVVYNNHYVCRYE